MIIHSSAKAKQAEWEGCLMILTHILRLPEISEAAHEHLAHQNPFEAFPELTMIWSTFREYWANYGQKNKEPISMIWLLDDLRKQTLPGFAAAASFDDLESAVRLMYGIDKAHLSSAMATATINQLKDDRILGSIKDLFHQQTDSDKIIEGIKNLSSNLGVSVNEKPLIRDNVLDDSFQDRLASISREPIGIPFMDTMLAGGLGVGEKLGFVIPTGCGKTTIGFQISEAKVAADHLVVYVQTEQDLDGDLQQRICTLASGSSKKSWEAFSDAIKNESAAKDEFFKFLKPDELERFKVMRPKWNKNFWFIDYTDPNKSLTSVDLLFSSLHDEEIRSGRKINTVIIDWWGRIVDRIAMRSGKDEASLRRLKREAFDQLKSWASKMKIRVIVFQQTAGASVSKKKAPSAADAQEDKNFPVFFDVAFAMTKLNDAGEGILTADKVRRGSKSTFRVVLDGEHGKLLSKDETKQAFTMKGEQKQGDVWL